MREQSTVRGISMSSIISSPQRAEAGEGKTTPSSVHMCTRVWGLGTVPSFGLGLRGTVATYTSCMNSARSS